MPTSLVPAMTANNAPSPYVASASSEFYPAFEVFDEGTVYDLGWFASGGLPQWVQVRLGAVSAVESYTIKAWMWGSWGDQSARSPKSWTLSGSTDGSSWTTLDTRTGQTAWAGDETRTFTAQTQGQYLYYRLTVTENNGDPNYTDIYHINLYAPTRTATTTTLTSSLNPAPSGQSVTFTATVTPTSGSGKPTGTVTFYDGTTVIGTGVLS